jgi:two-component system response regulator YesN
MYQILIADDEPIERAVLYRTIKKYYKNQLEVIQAENGRRAVELFDENSCHIALLDIEMPGINGLEAARLIREKNKNCSIIFLTAFDDFNYAKKAISVRVLDYLLKPSSDEELIAVLDEAIHLAEISEKKSGNIINFESSGRDFMNSQKADQTRLSAVCKAILEFIYNNYNEDISLQDAAKALNYADAYFCKIFKQCFDMNFTTYLSNFRVEKAKLQLEDITVNVKDISENVGFRDSNYFAKVFKRIVGVTPSEYRMKVLE